MKVFDRVGVIGTWDIVVDQNNPDVVVVGTDEANNSRTAYFGDGAYKSTDGGKTWRNIGLKESHHVGRKVIHPTDTKIVSVTAVGHLYSENKERGLFETRTVEVPGN